MRIASCLLLSLLASACTHSPAEAAADPVVNPAVDPAVDPATDSAPLPGWLRTRIADYERQPARQAPSAIWRITHQGAPAFYLVSPCCDQFNPLLDVKGKEICSPSGGFTGAGDGKCPRPMDAGTQATRIWVHPGQAEQDPAPPGLESR